MRKRMKLKSYPCIEAAGLIWTYMGPPELKPEPPALEWVKVSPERRFVSKRLQESNYLQALEGGIDSSHVSFLHSGALKRDPLFVGSKGNEYNEGDKMPHFDVVDFEGGLLIGARRNAENDRYYWRITPWIMPTHTDHSASRADTRSAPMRGCRSTIRTTGHGASITTLRALTDAERTAMKDGTGIHVKYVPGTFIRGRTRPMIT